MTKDENRKFIMKSESMVLPEDVTTISFLGDFNRILPKKTQQKIMEKGAQEIPYMGFIVDPYCFFMAYRIKNISGAQEMLPPGYELESTSLFEGYPQYPLMIFCAFSVRTSAFIGRRLEIYIIARNKKTGLLSWVIADYETNTNSHDPKNGFCGYTSEPSVLTTTPYGELLVHFKSRERSEEFFTTVNMDEGNFEALNQDLWVEGNLSIDYGGLLKNDNSKPFSLIFDPFLMKEAKNISLDHVEIGKNTYFKDILHMETPIGAAVFPYSQHFIIKQDLTRDELMDKEDLFTQARAFLDRKGFKTMKGNDIKKPLYLGILISSLLNLGVIILLFLKAFT